MKIVGAASVFPNHVYSQQATSGALKKIWQDKLQRSELIDRRHAHCGVERRHLSLPIEQCERLQKSLLS